MATERRLLIAVSEDEKGDFLADPVFEQILGVVPESRRIDTADLDQGRYLQILDEYRPEILVSAWSTPGLPEEKREAILDHLRYQCHLTGTIRKFVPKSYLERGLRVTNWGSSISATIAECALLLSLAALRRMTYWSFEMHQREGWKPHSYIDNYSLIGRRVGLHGFGAIARAFVGLVKPFGVSIKAHSPSVPDAVFAEHDVSRAATLEELFQWSDVLVELAPKKPEYYHIVTEELLRMMAPGSVFVNVGRGACVDEAALTRVAAEGRIQVGLDVYEAEPLPADSPLRGMENVTLMPHIAGPTRDRRVDSGRLALRNIRAYLEGGALEAEVTAAAYDRIT